MLWDPTSLHVFFHDPNVYYMVLMSQGSTPSSWRNQENAALFQLLVIPPSVFLLHFSSLEMKSIRWVLFVKIQKPGNSVTCPMVQVPVGRATLGRIINVIGEAIDERGDISKSISFRCQDFSLHQCLHLFVWMHQFPVCLWLTRLFVLFSMELQLVICCPLEISTHLLLFLLVVFYTR